MNINIFTVNYHNDKLVFKFIDSVIRAKENSCDINVKIDILDNSEKDEVELSNFMKEIEKFDIYTKLHSEEKNVGYFGGLPLCQKLVDVDTDISIYCNSDLDFDVNFFNELKKTYDHESAMIAPAIITIDTGVDQNPKYMARLSKRKLDFLDIIYSNRILFATHDFLSKVKELIFKKIGKTDAKPLSGTNIYAPHGAVFIFTDMEFLKKLPTFECFLFGEEIFIAEEAQTKNKKIKYEPSIIVNDERHASISLLSMNSHRKFHEESIKYLLSRYYS